MFELEVEGLLFSESWNELKARNTFEWENKDKQHDPYDVRQFGDQLQSISTKDTIGTTGSGLREGELAWEEQYNRQAREIKVKRTKAEREEKLESGFDSVFEQLATYTGQPVPVSKPQV